MTPADTVMARISEVVKHGHGQIVVKVFEGKIVEIETLKRERPK
jgi:hypothetical protein